MDDIRSASMLLEEYQRHTTHLEELRVLLHERLAAARAELDTITGRGPMPPPPGAGEPIPLTWKRAQRVWSTLGEIEAAIERLDFGVYGTCQRCGSFIPLDRLRDTPHVQHCAACHGGGR